MQKMSLWVAATAVLTVPAHGASLQADAETIRAGAFVGARLRLPLSAGGSRKLQAALSVAPLRSYRSGAASAVTYIGEGVAVDFASGRPALTLGGYSTPAALGLRRQGVVTDKQRLGISTGGWIAIGLLTVGAIVAVTQFTCVGEDKDFCGSD
jgi:hypothetical protein